MSKLIIVSDNQHLSQLMIKTLTHYFPSNSQDSIFIDTKYYTCEVQIQSKKWHITEGNNKQYQFLILLKQNPNGINPEQIDKFIQIYSPSSYLLIAHGNKSIQSTLGSSISQCNNFVDYIVEDLQKTFQQKMLWKNQGLLKQNLQEPSIFTLFQLLHTTPWQNLQKKQIKQKKLNVKEVANLEKVAVNQQKLESQQDKLAQQNNEQEDKKQNSDDKDDDFQKQMLQFDSLMSELVTMKDNTNYKENQRKKKAESIFFKLAKDFI